jgi:phosphoglycolate phosphatase-like HAD superfamily hydrolase
MKFKTIIFDLDGTIADTLPLCIAAFKKSVELLLQSTISEEEIIATFGPSEEGTIRRLIPQHEEEGVKAYLKNYEELHLPALRHSTGLKSCWPL